MSAIERLPNSVTKGSYKLLDAVLDLFEYKATDKDFEKCKIIVEKMPRIVFENDRREERIWRNEWFISTVKNFCHFVFLIIEKNFTQTYKILFFLL